MKNEGYGKYIVDQIDHITVGKPIFSDDIAKEVANHFNLDKKHATDLVNANLKRIADHGQLARYQKGTYYKTKITVFGKSKLNPELVIREKYLINGSGRIGYETGPSLLNHLGLTSQVPKCTYLATNKVKRIREQSSLKLVLHAPKVTVNDENNDYLQILDAVEGLDQGVVDAPQPERIIQEQIRQRHLDRYKLLGFAAYYPKKVQKRIKALLKNEVK
jgi:hypothetical protein